MRCGESSASKLGNHPGCLRFDADDLNEVFLNGWASTRGSKHFFNGLLTASSGPGEVFGLEPEARELAVDAAGGRAELGGDALEIAAVRLEEVS